MAHADKMLRSQINAYSDSWKSPHEQAMEYWDLQDVLRMSLSLFDSIRARDQRWSDEVRGGRRPYIQTEAEEFHYFYSAWLAPAKEILENMRRCERNGFALEAAQRFREAVTHARLAASESVQQTIDSIRDLEQGRGVPLAEVRDELRSRRLARGA